MIRNSIIQNSIGSSETTREPPFYDTSNIHTSPSTVLPLYEASSSMLGKRKKQITDYSNTNSVFVSDGKVTPPKLTLGKSANYRVSEVLKECYNFDFDNYIKYHQPEHKCKEDISITIHFLE